MVDLLFQWDVDRNPTDTWLDMEIIHEKGLAKSIGVSNYTKDQLLDVLKRGKVSKFNLEFQHQFISFSRYFR